MLCLIELLGLLTSQGLDMLDFFTNLGVLEFPVRYLALFLLFSVIGGFGWFWMGNLHKNIQLMLEFLKGPFFVLLGIAIYADDTTLYSKCDQASDLWQQLELASKLESDLRDIVDWGRRWLGDVNSGKTQLGLTGLITLVLLM